MEIAERPVSTYMTAPVLTVRADDDVTRAEELMRTHLVSAILVEGKGGAAVGVVSRRDLLRGGRVLAMARGRQAMALLDLPKMAAADLMHHPVVSVTPDTSIDAACRLLVDKKIHRVFVLDGDRSVGVFGTKEAMAAVFDARIATPLGEVMTAPAVVVDTQTPLGEVVEKVELSGVAGVVVAEHGLPVGLVTEVEALQARDLSPSTPAEQAMTQALVCLPVRTPLYRAAGFTVATRARRIVVVDHHHAQGVVTGLDFAKALIDRRDPPALAQTAG